MRFCSAHEPAGQFKMVLPRQHDVEYDVEPRGAHFFIQIRCTVASAASHARLSTEVQAHALLHPCKRVACSALSVGTCMKRSHTSVTSPDNEPQQGAEERSELQV